MPPLQSLHHALTAFHRAACLFFMCKAPDSDRNCQSMLADCSAHHIARKLKVSLLMMLTKSVLVLFVLILLR